jgi:hypothetical protein
MMPVVGLLVLVWLIVGAIAAFLARVFHPRGTELCQRGHDRADRARRTAQLRGCQPQGDRLQRAATQLKTTTAQFQPM